MCGGAKGGEGGGELEGLDSGVRFLALCRVMIGKILVTAKNSTGFPHVTDKSYDSMYSPAQEEYKLLNPGYVLPEFLVQYRFKGKEVDISAPPSGFDIDLSTSVVQLTKFDHKKEAAGTNLSQFPIGAGAGGDGMGGAKSQTAEGSEGGGAISITRCVSWTSPHRPTLHLLLSLTPPPPSTSHARTPPGTRRPPRATRRTARGSHRGRTRRSRRLPLSTPSSSSSAPATEVTQPSKSRRYTNLDWRMTPGLALR